MRPWAYHSRPRPRPGVVVSPFSSHFIPCDHVSLTGALTAIYCRSHLDCDDGGLSHNDPRRPCSARHPTNSGWTCDWRNEKVKAMKYSYFMLGGQDTSNPFGCKDRPSSSVLPFRSLSSAKLFIFISPTQTALQNSGGEQWRRRWYSRSSSSLS